LLIDRLRIVTIVLLDWDARNRADSCFPRNQLAASSLFTFIQPTSQVAVSEGSRLMALSWTMNRRRPSGSRRKKSASPAVEGLEARALLAVPAGYPIYGPPPGTMPPQPPAMPSPHKLTGVVIKMPRFYKFYAGPKWAELNAVKASAKLAPTGDFTFTGTNQGRINKAPAVFFWGIDRNGNLPPGPFQGRPKVKFDAVVVVSLDSSLTPMAKVTDLTTGLSTTLSADAVSIHGRTVTVRTPGSLLPSTGLAPSHYRFNYWPESGGTPGSSSVASFAPEFTTAMVGTSK
jgi:hypothetical protein